MGGKRAAKQRRAAGKVAILCEADGPRVARLFHTWRRVTTTDTASDLLVEAIGLLPATLRVGVLTAGAGFVTLELPNPTQRRLPDEGEFAPIVQEAQRAAEAVRDVLPSDRPTLCIGIDVLAACRRSPRRRKVGQFAAVIGPGRSDILLVSKGFPTSGEESYLRVPDAENGLAAHAFETPLGTVAVLVCHDINVYNRRGTATTESQRRKDWRDGIQQEVANAQPALGLHLAHYIETQRRFLDAYHAWGSEVEVPLVGVSALDAGIQASAYQTLLSVRTSVKKSVL